MNVFMNFKLNFFLIFAINMIILLYIYIFFLSNEKLNIYMNFSELINVP